MMMRAFRMVLGAFVSYEDQACRKPTVSLDNPYFSVLAVLYADERFGVKVSVDCKGTQHIVHAKDFHNLVQYSRLGRIGPNLLSKARVCWIQH
jgi:hypothetical protein